MTAPADAQQGHNSGNFASVDEMRRRAMFYRAKQRYQSALSKKKDADAAFKNECKSLKQIDVDIADIKFAIELDNDEDGKATEQFRRRFEIATWHQHDIGHQFDLLDQPDRKPLVDRAREEGFEAGSTDKAMSANPYEPSTDGYQPWMQGWHLGTEHAFDLDGHMRAEAAKQKGIGEAGAADDGGEAAADKPKRGRRKGTKNKPKDDAVAAPAEVDDSIPTETAAEAVDEPEIAAESTAVVDTTFADRRAARAAEAADDFPEMPDFLRRASATAPADDDL